MTYREILEPIATSPELPQLLKELNDIWQKEQKRRADFYDWVSPDIKAEFIEGEIIVHSPVRNRHSQVLGFIIRLIGTFVDMKNLGSFSYESNMCRFPRNDYEPDFVFFDKETAKVINDETTIFPIPQLIIEILSISTQHRDRGVKFKDYEVNGVQEYWIIDAKKDIIEQYLLKEGEFILEKKHNQKNTLTSKVLTNFSVPVKAFFDKGANLTALKNI